MDQNYYQRLRLRRDALPKQIKQAFRKLALLYHPDKGGTAEQYKAIQEAYDVLSDPEKRKLYDSQLGNIVESHHYFSGEDIQIGIRLTNEDLERGYITVAYIQNLYCSECNGGGSTYGRCQDCSGTGTGVDIHKEHNMVIKFSSVCKRCLGSGVVEISHCTVCNGTGYARLSRRLKIRLSDADVKKRQITINNAGHQGNYEFGDLHVLLMLPN